MKEENLQLEINLKNSEAKVAEQQLIINYQRKEINEFEKKTNDQDDQMTKMNNLLLNREEKITSLKKDLEQVNKENIELKNKVEELQKLLNQRFVKFYFNFD